MSIRKKILTVIISLIISLIFLFAQPVLAADLNNGAKLFEVQCAGCHPNGNNIIRRGKTLKLKALKRNQVDSLEAITQLVTYGKSNMSSFQDRLTPSEIEDVAAYVLKQAENNWH